MKKNSMWGILILISVGLIILLGTTVGGQEAKMIDNVYTLDQITHLCTWSAQDIEKHIDKVLLDAKQQIDAIINVAPSERSYDTIARPLDYVCTISDFAIMSNIVSTLQKVSPSTAIREAAHKALLKFQNFAIDTISNNRLLYEAFKEYSQNNALKEKLTPQQEYFIKQTLIDFERAGLGLPTHELLALSDLKKEITKLSMEFARNISEANSFITATSQELTGLSKDALSRLEKNEDGLYRVGVDYPTVDAVLQNCSIENTRKRLFIAFNNRAYPVNDSILTDLLAKRDLLAKKLGYASYAAFDLANQMVLSPQNATDFLNDLIAQSAPKEAQEYALLITDLPESVTLLPNGKIKVWDVPFLKEYYKKKHFDVDQEAISHYFPLEKTIQGLLKIYQAFLDIRLQQVSIKNIWHEDVQAIQVYTKDNTLLGTLLLDLHPRDNKYTHACEGEIVPAIIKEDGSRLPGVCIVIANFPKSTQEKPALFKLNDVNTFFHEFGHALHALLGATTIASLSGTNTKTDFVELPSQMLEEWLWDKEILTMISGHYITGEPLPTELINNIIALKQFDSGSFVQRQAFLSMLSLEYYKEGAPKDLYGIMKRLHEEIRPHVAFEPEDHMYASYGHLPSYAAKYYGYLWSRVFALDIFSQIKQEGLLNPEAGKKYIDCILSRGGSQDPNELLFNYLGRKPNNKAFLLDMGLISEPESLITSLETLVDIQMQ